MLCSMWDLPGQGLEPMSPALAGGFLTTEPPGKSQEINFVNKVWKLRHICIMYTQTYRQTQLEIS